MKTYNRKAIFTSLKKYDTFADEDDFIEITLWHNGEGIDVEIGSKLPERFQLTWGELEALKKLVKELDKY